MIAPGTSNGSSPVIKAINLFLVLFLLFGILLWGIVAIFYNVLSQSIISTLESQEIYTVNLQKTEIGKNIDGIVSDLLFLSRQNELQAYLETGEKEALRAIEREYKELAFRKKTYDQLRYLDITGQEIVRINYNAGIPSSVEEKDLQNKGKRYYFIGSVQLQQDEIFISPLDLNIEHGEIEQPFKPMIRMGTPVFDTTGRKRGVLLINYLAKVFLDTIRRTSSLTQGKPMLLNRNGYWLLSSDEKKEWGFMIKGRENCSFAVTYPEEWEKIIEKESGQFYTENGLFTFNTVHPLQKSITFSSGSNKAYAPNSKELDSSRYLWVLVSHISQEELKAYVTPLQLRIFFFGAVLFILVALGAWFLALAITKRRIYQSQLLSMALYDTLTSLPNRKHFFDRLEMGIAHAQRHGVQLGLLYIDLDGFKAVNDTFGHEAGDELLVKVSQRMTAVTRKTDTVARLGGDEFAIILFQVNSLEAIQTVGNKIIQAVNKPVKLRTGTVTVGASIGAAAYPDTTRNTKELIKFADQAMYLSKSKGKNICTFSEVRQEQ